MIKGLRNLNKRYYVGKIFQNWQGIMGESLVVVVVVELVRTQGCFHKCWSGSCLRME